MEKILKIDKVGGTFHHHPREGWRDVAYIERRARKCGLYGEDWRLERVTEWELVFVRGNERSVVRPSVTPIPNAFLDAEFHYVHTAWPQYFPDANPVVGEAARPSASTIPTVDELSSFVENQVLSLLRMFR